MGRQMDSISCLFMFLFLLGGALFHFAAAVDHEVGGSFGWNLPKSPTFYSEWAENNTFHVGDWMVFRTESNETHNFAGPSSQADFDGCVDPKLVFIPAPSLSIRVVEPGRHYFICTVENHCKLGMKFSIDVLPQPGAPPFLNSASFFTAGSAFAKPLIISAVALLFF